MLLSSFPFPHHCMAPFPRIPWGQRSFLLHSPLDLMSFIPTRDTVQQSNVFTPCAHLTWSRMRGTKHYLVAKPCLNCRLLYPSQTHYLLMDFLVIPCHSITCNFKLGSQARSLVLIPLPLRRHSSGTLVHD